VRTRKKRSARRIEGPREQAPESLALRRQHAAVESIINVLEVHGLDRCLDHVLVGFKRHVALAVVGRKIHRLGMVAAANKRREK
jgi:transposase, IS5 family